MPLESIQSALGRSQIELLHELIRASLDVWEVNADVVLGEDGLAVRTGAHVVSIRCDPRSAVARWWVKQMAVGLIEDSRERPRISSLGVLRDLRKLLSTKDG